MVLQNLQEQHFSSVLKKLTAVSESLAYLKKYYFCYRENYLKQLSDFLLRQKVDDNNPHEIIPISFNIWMVLQDKYYKLKEKKEKCMIQTRSQTKASGLQLPEVHGTRK